MAPPWNGPSRRVHAGCSMLPGDLGAACNEDLGRRLGRLWLWDGSVTGIPFVGRSADDTRAGRIHCNRPGRHRHLRRPRTKWWWNFPRSIRARRPDTPWRLFLICIASGISVTDMQPATSEIVLINNRGLYQGAAVAPTTSQNLITQVNTGNVPASFTLKFAEPARSASFTRPALYPATESGITHPAWSVHALDAQGRELSSQSEGLTRCWPPAGCKEVPPVVYALRAPALRTDRGVALRLRSAPRRQTICRL